MISVYLLLDSLYLDFCFTEKIKDLLFGVNSSLCEYKRNYHSD